MSRLPCAWTVKGGSIMQEAVLSPLATWQNFYVVGGTAAATVTGLMFVVITLSARTRERGPSGALGAFGAPTVVDFGAALLVAAILNAPWQVLWNPGLLLGLCGLGGVIYVVIVLRRAPPQTHILPLLEGRLCHTGLPLPFSTPPFYAAQRLPSTPPTPTCSIRGPQT